MPLALLPPHLSKRNNVSLEADDQGTEWLGALTIGATGPGQSFMVDYDTGSADLWVAKSSGCTGCQGKNTYNPSLSPASVAQGRTFSTRYADGSTVSGPVYTDWGASLHQGHSTISDLPSVTASGVTALDQTFAAVTQISPLFQNDPIDGVLGMAFQSISTLNAVSTILSYTHIVKIRTYRFAAPVLGNRSLPVHAQRFILVLDHCLRWLDLPWRYRCSPLHRNRRVPPNPLQWLLAGNGRVAPPQWQHHSIWVRNNHRFRNDNHVWPSHCCRGVLRECSWRETLQCFPGAL